MRHRVIFLMDNINFKGGAHFATFNIIKILHRKGFYISIYSILAPNDEIKNALPFAEIDNPPDPMSLNLQSLLLKINTYDIVCVPFQDSLFREVAAVSDAYKIQWIPTNYKIWKESCPQTESMAERDRQIYGNADKIVFVSKTSQDGFVSIYPELKNKTQVCYNLIDTKRITTLANELIDNSKDSDFKIVTVARMCDFEKGIIRTLDVIKSLYDEGYTFSWCFIGDGDDLDLFKLFSHNYGLDNCVSWLGHSDNPYKYVNNADLFALFSYYEGGTPVAVYESLIIGTPVISTYYCTNEDYTPADGGWWVENNKDAIYEAMKYLLDNKDLIKKAHTALKEYEYDTGECEKQVLEIFNTEARERNQ